jgi:hypothetical protein
MTQVATKVAAFLLISCVRAYGIVLPQPQAELISPLIAEEVRETTGAKSYELARIAFLTLIRTERTSANSASLNLPLARRV